MVALVVVGSSLQIVTLSTVYKKIPVTAGSSPSTEDTRDPEGGEEEEEAQDDAGEFRSIHPTNKAANARAASRRGARGCCEAYVHSLTGLPWCVLLRW